MPLDDYRRKRNFARTPEPRGDDSPRRGRSRRRSTHIFCVQKHLSSHLHYDLRLEHDGVLLSWAVPKGPSIHSRDRRLAMQTEDHPLGYGSFEGVIPEGYGAGIVMLWDQGTWAPEVENIDEALRLGNLKFSLDGYKLKGSWALVRTADRQSGASTRGGRSWLLIKHRDEWSGPIDITTFAPRSVKSDGEFEDILAADSPEIWRTQRPAKSGATGAKLAEVIKQAATIRVRAIRDRAQETADAEPPADSASKTRETASQAKTAKRTARKKR